MSLTSSSSALGGIKEYVFRGIQQLPLVLTATSVLFTVTTGSIAHLNLAIGLIFLTPIYTWAAGTLTEFVLAYALPNQRVSWTRSTSDTCRLVPVEGMKPLAVYEPRLTGGVPVPSYWLMEVSFFIGYAISNAVDIYMTPAHSDANTNAVERRNWNAIFIMAAASTFAAIMLFVRFRTMSGCEGRGIIGIALSVLFAGGAATLGYGIYTLSRVCGARASDLFGVLSQFMPTSTYKQSPIVCSEESP